MVVVSRDSRPVAVKVTSATPFESTLVEDTLQQRLIAKDKIKRVTADKAYESDGLDKKLKKKKWNSVRRIKRTGLKFRHYKYRWVVERFFA